MLTVKDSIHDSYLVMHTLMRLEDLVKNANVAARIA